MSSFNFIYDLIKRGEDETLDFKQEIRNPLKIAKTMAAFANTNGGEIVIGISDQGDILGVDTEQEKHLLLRAAKRHCRPIIYLNFSTIIVAGAQILIVAIDKSKHGEHWAEDEHHAWHQYIRIKDQTTVIHDPDLVSSSEKANIPIPILTVEEKSLMRYLSKHDFISIKEYMRIMQLPYQSANRSLESMVDEGVLDVEFINNLPHYFLKDPD